MWVYLGDEYIHQTLEEETQHLRMGAELVRICWLRGCQLLYDLWQQLVKAVCLALTAEFRVPCKQQLEMGQR